jgi:hypothetical protein
MEVGFKIVTAEISILIHGVGRYRNRKNDDFVTYEHRNELTAHSSVY